MRLLSLAAWLLAATTVHAELAVTVSPTKVAGQKAVVPLVLKNGFSEDVRSARAVVFLLDEHGKVAGQSIRWVIGGQTLTPDEQRDPSKRKPGLAAGATNAFHFVVTSLSPPPTSPPKSSSPASSSQAAPSPIPTPPSESSLCRKERSER